MEIYENYSLKRLSTFGIDVKARRIMFLRGSTLDEPFRFMYDMDELLKSDFRRGPYMVIGEGSNIVFTKDYEGTLIKIGEATFHGGSDGQYKYLTVGARMLTDEVVRISVGYKYYGAENLSAIPGNIGAAVVQNVGAYGVEIKDLVDSVEAVDLLSGERRTLRNEECAFGYRTSLFKQQADRWLIWQVKLRFATTFKPVLTYKALADELQRRGIGDPTQQQIREVVTELRWSKLPRPEEYGSAGSFFKNPVVDEATYLAIKREYPDMPEAHTAGINSPALAGGNPGNPMNNIQDFQDFAERRENKYYKLSAGWLIDQCGWKGRTLGRAGVWPKQALVLYNTGGCTGQEVVDLARAIQNDVRRKFSVVLEPEAIIV